VSPTTKQINKENTMTFEIGQTLQAKGINDFGNEQTILFTVIAIENDVITIKSIDKQFSGSLNQFHNGGGCFEHIVQKIKIHANGRIEQIA
jgi:hypothetical protein